MGIKTFRLKRGLSQEELAKRVGLTQGAVSQWERGVSCPTVQTLRKVMKELDCTFAELMDEGGETDAN